MINCCCIYITVALALERYRAVWHPVEYHNAMSSGSPWRRVATCIAPVIMLSVAFNFPKFFEVGWANSTLPVVWSEETGENISVSYWENPQQTVRCSAISGTHYVIVKRLQMSLSDAIDSEGL